MTNRGNEQKMELIALTLLEEADKPLGAGRLAEIYRSQGIQIAEATAGRFLRSLDEAGLTHRLGKQGRLPTKAGRRRLRELRLRSELTARGTQLAAAAKVQDLRELIDLLHVRRAIEAEAARLAALRAEPRELERITAAADMHVRCIGTPGRIGHAHDFHLLVAQASHNRMLVAIASLLLEVHNERLAHLLDRLAAEAGLVLDTALEHAALADALRRREPDAAERSMRAHIDKLIDVANRKSELPATASDQRATTD
jgi:DNA-binding FadR family transcriptional regulator